MSVSPKEFIEWFRAENPKGWLTYQAILDGTNRAHLQGADLCDVKLRGVDLWAADLRDANLQGANLEGANLRDTDLRGIDFQGAKLWNTVLLNPGVLEELIEKWNVENKGEIK